MRLPTRAVFLQEIIIERDIHLRNVPQTEAQRLAMT